MLTNHAKFITFEGPDGSGKSTQTGLLATALRERGHRVLMTREPGGSPEAEVLREMLLHGQHDWSPIAETLLHFTARAQHIDQIIRPALRSGEWVVCDRYYDSTYAYQGCGQGVDLEFIQEMTRLCTLKPCLTIMLDVPEAVSRERLAQRGSGQDRYEGRDLGFQARVAAGYRAIAAAEPARCTTVSAVLDIDSVHAAVMAAVEARVGLMMTDQPRRRPTS